MPLEWFRFAFALCPRADCARLSFPRCPVHGGVLSTPVDPDSHADILKYHKVKGMQCGVAKCEFRVEDHVQCLGCGQRADVLSYFCTKTEVMYCFTTASTHSEDTIETNLLWCADCMSAEFPGTPKGLTQHRAGTILERQTDIPLHTNQWTLEHFLPLCAAAKNSVKFTKIQLDIKGDLTQLVPALNLTPRIQPTSFLMAAWTGDCEFLQTELLRNPAVAESRTPGGDTALMMACKKNHLEVIGLLLGLDSHRFLTLRKDDCKIPEKPAEDEKVGEEDPGEMSTEDVVNALGTNPLPLPGRCWVQDVNGKNSDGISALQYCVTSGFTRACAMLLEAKADPNALMTWGGAQQPAIDLAAAWGHAGIVVLLLKHKALLNWNDDDKNKGCALTLAVVNRRYLISKILLSHGADINYRASSELSPVMLAVLRKAKPLLLLMLGSSLDLEHIDKADQRQLTYEHSQLPSLEKILPGAVATECKWAAQLDYGLESADGETVLGVAIQEGEVDLIRILLKHCPPCDLRKHLVLSASRNLPEVCRVLVEQGGVGINDRIIPNGDTALTISCWLGFFEQTRLLLDLGADANLMQSSFLSPLMLAAMKDHLTIAALLLGVNPAPYLTGEAEKTPPAPTTDRRVYSFKVFLEPALALAVKEGHAQMVQLLADQGELEFPDRNVSVRGNPTSLMLASRLGHLEVVKALLSRGWNPNTVATNRGTALDFASRAGHSQVCEVLYAAGGRLFEQVRAPKWESDSEDDDDQERENHCMKTLPCSHPCCGALDEAECPPCLVLGCDARPASLNEDVHSKAVCRICYVSALIKAGSLILECGHAFHVHCVREMLTRRWNGLRIAFQFRGCPLCRRTMRHPLLLDLNNELDKLAASVESKALARLEHEGIVLEAEPAYAIQGGAFYQDKAGFAMNKFSFYMCFKCQEPYFGGDFACAQAADQEGVKANPSELVCGACAPVESANCAIHKREFVEFKCRYCCSIATFFCWGTTHFCLVCHRNSLELTSLPRDQLIPCPCLPKGHTGLPKPWTPPSQPQQSQEKQQGREQEQQENQHIDQSEGGDLLEDYEERKETICPLLGVWHPPTGEEFCLGCGVCRILAMAQANNSEDKTEHLQPEVEEKKPDTANETPGGNEEGVDRQIEAVVLHKPTKVERDERDADPEDLSVNRKRHAVG